MDAVGGPLLEIEHGCLYWNQQFQAPLPEVYERFCESLSLQCETELQGRSSTRSDQSIQGAFITHTHMIEHTYNGSRYFNDRGEGGAGRAIALPLFFLHGLIF